MLHSEARFMEWPPAGFDGLFGWDFLAGAVPQGITPMDLDAVLERRGHLLVFETKDIGAPIPTGQAITLTTLWKQYNATIFHIAGKEAGKVTGAAIYSGWDKDKRGNIGDKPLRPHDSYDVNYLTHCWWCKVEGTPKPDKDEYTRKLWLQDYEET